MQPWTLQVLERIAPKPGRRKSDDDDDHKHRLAIHAGYLNALVNGWDMLQRAEINTPLRLAHFVAQAAHETGGFTISRESTAWSAQRMCELWPNRFKATDPIFRARHAACRGDPEAIAELVYSAKVKPDLGNVDDGDAYAYRGGGFNQLTGRNNYRDAGQAIAVDLEGQPELIEDARVSLAVAIWEWRKHNLNQFADGNYGRAIANAINRGDPFSRYDPIGADDRKRWFDRAWAVLGNGQLGMPDLSLGADGPGVVDMQQRLHDLGYPCGAVDGVFGDECGRALAMFKRDWLKATGLPLDPGDKVGQATKAALATAEPVKRPEREAMTLKDLKAAGSTEVASADNMRRNGVILGIGGGMALAEQSQVMPTAVQTIDQHIGWLPGFRTMMTPVLEGLAWGLRNLLPLLLIAAAIWLYAYGWTWARKRLEAARRGLNLSR